MYRDITVSSMFYQDFREPTVNHIRIVVSKGCSFPILELFHSPQGLAIDNDKKRP